MPFQTGGWGPYLDGMAEKLESALADRQKESVYPQYVKVMTTKKQQDRDQEVENMNAAQHWQEGAMPPELEFHLGFPQVYTQSQWVAYATITKPMRKFAQKELVDRIMRQLRDATYKAKEIVATNYLEYGEVATSTSVPQKGGLPMVKTVGGDGLAIFSTAHTWLNSPGETWSNYSNSSLSLNEANFNTTLNAIDAWQDNTGAPLDLEASKIIIPSALVGDAIVALKSRLTPGSAANAVNIIPNRYKGGYIKNKWLASATAWYVLTDATNGKIQFRFGWDDEVTRGTLDPQASDFMRVDFSVAHGVNTPRGYYKVAA